MLFFLFTFFSGATWWSIDDHHYGRAAYTFLTALYFCAADLIRDAKRGVL